MLLAAVCLGVPAYAQPVDLELVLAVDVSTSVDRAEYELQRQGYADAFRDPEVISAIRFAGRRGIAVSLIHWAGSFQQETAVDWTLVSDETSAAELSAKIHAAQRSFAGLTGVDGVIRYSVEKMATNSFIGRRQTIDISADGTSDAESARLERDRAVAAGVTINGLAIYSDDHDLGILAAFTLRDHFTNDLLGGPGAFLITADGFEDFGTAIRRKLVREIIGLQAAELSPQR